MKVINLFGGPGSGKSTTAAGLFYFMKRKGYKVEVVAEYAKDLYYSGTLGIYGANRQELIFAEQAFRLERLKGHVDYAICECPILLSLAYEGLEVKSIKRAFQNLVIETHLSYDNINFYLDRPPTYQSEGREQNLEGAIEVDNKVLAVLKQLNLPYIQFNTNEQVVMNILHTIEGSFIGDR